MFWSMNKSTVLIRAGKKAAQRAHTGSAIRGTSQGRPTVVVSAMGTLRVGRARAYLSKKRASSKADEGQAGGRGARHICVRPSTHT